MGSKIVEDLPYQSHATQGEEISQSPNPIEAFDTSLKTYKKKEKKKVSKKLTPTKKKVEQVAEVVQVLMSKTRILLMLMLMF